MNATADGKINLTKIETYGCKAKQAVCETVMPQKMAIFLKV